MRTTNLTLLLGYIVILVSCDSEFASQDKQAIQQKKEQSLKLSLPLSAYEKDLAIQRFNSQNDSIVFFIWYNQLYRSQALLELRLSKRNEWTGLLYKYKRVDKMQLDGVPEDKINSSAYAVQKDIIIPKSGWVNFEKRIDSINPKLFLDLIPPDSVCNEMRMDGNLIVGDYFDKESHYQFRDREPTCEYFNGDKHYLEHIKVLSLMREEFGHYYKWIRFYSANPNTGDN